jgi:hypothetical protein
VRTESASSISVVSSSSIEKARAAASGRPSGAASGGVAGKPVPCGKNSKAKRRRK